MKRLLSLLCAALLCACCIVLVACGGSASGSSAASSAAASSGASSAAEPAADPADQFVGDWKLAAVEAQGLTVSGDFSGFLGSNVEAKFTFEAGGTGKAVFGEQSNDFSWTVNEAGEAVVTMQKAADDAASSASAEAPEGSEAAAAAAEGAADSLMGNSAEPITFKLDGDVLSAQGETNGQTMTLYLTKDGKLAGAKEINMADATPITSAADLEGEWTLVGMNMFGMTMYGDADSIAQMANGADMTLTFNADGTCVMSGSQANYSVGPEGAVISSNGTDIPVALLDDGIAIDAGAAAGAGIQMVLYYAR